MALDANYERGCTEGPPTNSTSGSSLYSQERTQPLCMAWYDDISGPDETRQEHKGGTTLRLEGHRN